MPPATLAVPPHPEEGQDREEPRRDGRPGQKGREGAWAAGDGRWGASTARGELAAHSPGSVPGSDDHGESHAPEGDCCRPKEPLPRDGLRGRDGSGSWGEAAAGSTPPAGSSTRDPRPPSPAHPGALARALGGQPAGVAQHLAVERGLRASLSRVLLHQLRELRVDRLWVREAGVSRAREVPRSLPAWGQSLGAGEGGSQPTHLPPQRL